MNKISTGELLDRTGSLLLGSLSSDRRFAMSAFSDWRSTETLDASDSRARRIMPVLADLLRSQAPDHPDLVLMRGVSRFVWTTNLLKFRLLLQAIRALESESIRPLLLKGAALYARFPGLERKRASGDCDILLKPSDVVRGGAALRRAGFDMSGHSWDDLAGPLIASYTAGLPIKMADRIGEVDLHWRPLWNIDDPALTELFFRQAEQKTLHGQAVLVPCREHHLFSSIARCEPWNANELFTRLTEGAELLREETASIDWDDVHRLIKRYGVDAAAEAYLKTIADHAGLKLPSAALSGLQVSKSYQSEWRIRRTPPDRRTAWQCWRLTVMDARFRRTMRPISPPGLLEASLRRAMPSPLVLQLLWQLARRRVILTAGDDTLRFLEGFSSPETDGVWTDGYWALLQVSEKRIELGCVEFDCVAFSPNKRRQYVWYSGGQGVGWSRFSGPKRLTFRVRSLPEIGGGGLLLFWLPRAASPKRLNVSADERQLALFIRKERNPKTLNA